MKQPWRVCNRLLAAISGGDVEEAARVIDCGFDVDSILMEGKSAICISIERGKAELVELFLKKGCSLSLKTPKGDYPLHLAVKHRYNSLVEMLLNNRVDLTALDFSGKTALHIACEENLEDIARKLIQRSTVANLNIADRKGRTPLMCACEFARKELVEYLVSKGSKINITDSSGESPLLLSVFNSSIEIMEYLLNIGVNVGQKNDKGESALLRALRKSYENDCYRMTGKNSHFEKMVLMLIEHGSDLTLRNSLGQSPLHIAVCANEEIIVKKLLNYGSEINIFDDLRLNPLYYACRNANKRILNLLIDGGANLKIYDWTKLKEHLKKPDSCDLVDYLIEKTKEVQPLSALCRSVIRKSFTKGVEKYANLLPIPTLLTNYIIQFDE